MRKLTIITITHIINMEEMEYDINDIKLAL